MATYRADVTQNIEPVVADYSPQIRALSAGAAAADSAANAKVAMATLATNSIGSLYDMYKTNQMQGIQKEAAGVTEEFRSSNVEAQETQRDAQNNLRSIGRGMGVDSGYGGPSSTAQESQEVKDIAVQVQRLKAAKAGGMSTSTYLSRLHALTKKSIAALPYKADEIRGIIASETGLGKDTVDENLYFVKEQFNPARNAADPLAEDKMVAKTITAMVAGKIGNPLELQELYQNDRQAFIDGPLRQFNQQQQLEATNATLKADLEGLEVADTQVAKAATPRIKGIMIGSIALGLSKEIGNKESELWKIADLQATGQIDVNASNYQAYVGTFSTKLLSIIEENRLAARNNINTLLEQRQNIPLEQQKAMFQAVEDEATSLSKKYTDKSGVGLRAMATVFTNHKNEALNMQIKRVDLAMKAMNVFPTSFVEAVMAGGSAEQQIKKLYPAAWAIITKNAAIAESGTQEITMSQELGASLAEINSLVTSSKKAGTPVVPADNTPEKREVAKAAQDVVVNNALDVVTNKAELDSVDAALVSSAVTSMVLTGGHKNQLMKRYKQLGSTLREKLSVEDYATLKQNVSSSASQSVANIQMYRDQINEKYNSNFVVAVTGEGLMTLVADPTVGERGPEDITPEARGFTSEQRDAISEFRNMAGPITATAVFGRAMLTEEDPAAIAQEYALAINGNQPVKPFYDGQGVVPTATSNVVETAQPVTQPATVEPAPATSNDSKYDTQGDLQKIIENNEALKARESKATTESNDLYMTPKQAFTKFNVPKEIQANFLRGAKNMGLDPVTLADQFSRLTPKQQEDFIKRLT